MKKGTQKGFTLTELLVVMFIAMLLMVFTVGWVGSQYGNYKFSNAVNGLKNAVNLARMRAMSNRGGTGTTFFLKQIQAAGPTITFTIGNDPYSGAAPVSSLKASQQYYIYLVGLSPTTNASGTVDVFPWFMNDRLCEMTSIPNTTLSSPTFTCQCPLRDDTPNTPATYIDISAGTYKLVPSTMNLASSSTAVVSTILQLVSVPGGTVLDSTTGEKMGNQDYYRIRDLGGVIEFDFNPTWIHLTFKTDNTVITDPTPKIIVFDPRGMTKDLKTHEIQMEYWTNTTVHRASGSQTYNTRKTTSIQTVSSSGVTASK
ncbi:MAG TPA: type II secretion system protein [Desulfomonilaceae bacterium]|nr:type II secretion system protein [Desulfomonilaceae bacterium]